MRTIRRQVDEAVRELWAQACMPSAWSLVAVGGYGRGELFPYSDVDLLVLVDAAPRDDELPRLEQFVGACWDAGLAIGHTVRTVAECVREQRDDVTIQTALLERRFLAGAHDGFEALGLALAGQPEPEPFFAAKMAEKRRRHARYEDTPYSLEPNTKESPGGLRDLHTIAWVARAAGLGKSWAQMHANGLLTQAELQMIEHNERLLRRIRISLHIVAGRREDRLVFDLQGSVAALLGYLDRPDRRASEQLMQRYYRAAKTITQLSTLLLQNIEERLGERNDEPAQVVDDEFCSRKGLLECNDPSLFERDPAAILRAFLALQRHGGLHGMSTPTLRAIWNARRRIDGQFRREPANRALFMSILREPRGITRALRSMNQWSILGHYLPQFRRIVGRMQHDLFHVYTVDQHIITVVRNLRRFALPEHAHEYPLCSQLMASVEQPHLLYVAALFHDIAKGRGGDHSTLGASDARRFCRQHRIDRAGTELVEFLVLHHLTMSTVAQKQDLADPAVLRRFASIVRTEERLVALYLLTVADIRGTSPKVWNGWKAKLLQDLFHATKRLLDGESEAPSQRLDARHREAIRILDLYAIDPASYKRFWDDLDIAYFLRTEAEDVAWHTRVLARNAFGQAPVVRSRLSRFGEGFQVLVYVPDQSDLFARICGYFDSVNLSVIDAQIHTTGSGYALDSFLVVDPFAQTPYRDRLMLVESQLSERLARRAPLVAPIEGRSSRRSRSFPVKPIVELRADESGRQFLLSIVANDRTGLLYRIALVLARHGVNVHTARVATLGERAEDTFLIDGPALSNPNHQLQIEAELTAAVRMPSRASVPA